jgi:hypothetical protein
LRAKSNIAEFVLLKSFQVQMKYANAPVIKEVTGYLLSLIGLNKCNCDGASNGNPGPSSCRGTFRYSDASFLGAYASNLGINSSLNAELFGAMLAIEAAAHNGWIFGLKLTQCL